VTLTQADLDQCARAIRIAAARLRPRWGTVVERGDLHQAGWLAVVEAVYFTEPARAITEVAADLGMTANAARAAHWQALRRLRKLLEAGVP